MSQEIPLLGMCHIKMKSPIVKIYVHGMFLIVLFVVSKPGNFTAHQ